MASYPYQRDKTDFHNIETWIRPKQDDRGLANSSNNHNVQRDGLKPASLCNICYKPHPETVYKDDNNKLWHCGICSMIFVYRYTCVRHVKIHRQRAEYCQEQFKFVCQICQRRFKENKAYNNHKQTHKTYDKFRNPIKNTVEPGIEESIIRRHPNSHSTERVFNTHIAAKNRNQLKQDKIYFDVGEFAR